MDIQPVCMSMSTGIRQCLNWEVKTSTKRWGFIKKGSTLEWGEVVQRGSNTMQYVLFRLAEVKKKMHHDGFK